MGIVLWIIVFGAALALLVKSSDYFIVSAESIGLFFGLPSFIIGVVIVAMGTSLPELVSSIVSVTEGSSEIVVGNVLGSNIANIGLVIGIAALIGKDMLVKYDIMKVDMPFMLGSALLLFFMLMDGRFSLPEAVLSLVCLAVFIFYALRSGELGVEEKPKKPKFYLWLLLVGTPFGIYFGAKYTIRAVMEISELIGIGREIIALTAVALGTSLPEVFVSISAARKGKAEIAVGNVVGSNIFNTFAVMGIPRLIGDLEIPASVLSFPAPVSVGMTVFFLVVIMDKRLNPWIGVLLLVFYIFFIGRVFGFF